MQYRVQSVERRLIERVDGGVERRREIGFRQSNLVMLGSDCTGDCPCDIAFVELLLVEAERERMDRRRVGTLSQGRDRAGVDAAGQENPDRNVGDQVPRDAVLHDLPELGLADRSSVLVARDAPVRRAPHRAGGLDRAPFAGTEQLDPRDGGDGSHDEPVPEDRPDSPAIQTGMFQQAGCQDRPNLGREHQRPLPVRVRVLAEVERLDAERIAGQQEPARLVVPEREREHSAQHPDRVGPPEREQAQHDRGVAARLERLAGLLEVAPQILEVVDLAVEDDRPVVATGAVSHRLIARRRQVDDREATVAQHAPDAVGVRAALPDTRAIRTTMRERIGHPLQSRPVPAVDAPEDARYSTHMAAGGAVRYPRREGPAASAGISARTDRQEH